MTFPDMTWKPGGETEDLSQRTPIGSLEQGIQPYTTYGGQKATIFSSSAPKNNFELLILHLSFSTYIYITLRSVSEGNVEFSTLLHFVSHNSEL